LARVGVANRVDGPLLAPDLGWGLIGLRVSLLPGVTSLFFSCGLNSTREYSTQTSANRARVVTSKNEVSFPVGHEDECVDRSPLRCVLQLGTFHEVGSLRRVREDEIEFFYTCNVLRMPSHVLISRI
jgi:hypothetical protein